MLLCSCGAVDGPGTCHSKLSVSALPAFVTVNDIDGFVGHGMLVLNGTDGSSTNAGDNFDLEGATGITV